MAWVVVAGAGVSAVGAIAGGLMNKQKAPGVAPPIDIGKEAGKVLGFNEQNLPRMQALAGKVNRDGITEQGRLMEQMIPGIGRLQEHYRQQLQEDLTTKGLPKEVETNLRRKAAEMGVNRGTKGGINQFSLLRDFGFNMLDWERGRRAQAMQTFQNLSGVSPRINPMSPQSMFITNQQAFNTANSNQSAQQAGLNAQAAAENANRAARAQMISGVLGAVGGGVMAYGAAGGGFGGPKIAQPGGGYARTPDPTIKQYHPY